MDYATRWAERNDLSDGERVAAGQVGSYLMSRFKIRSDSQTRTVTAKDRLSHDDAFWNIKGVKEAKGGRSRFIEITAVRDAD